MKRVSIRRRTIVLEPATDADVKWIVDRFDDEDTWKSFRFSGPTAKRAGMTFFALPLITAVIRRADSMKRIGFVIMFPPEHEDGAWEFGYSIPDPKDRDAFSAINATDAMGCYMFDCLEGVEAVEWTVEVTNRAAHAVVRRLGYAPQQSTDAGDGEIMSYRIDAEGWRRRRAKLAAYAAKDGKQPFGVESFAGVGRFMTIAADTPEPVRS